MSVTLGFSFDSSGVWIREDKIIENYTLEVALKFQDFQGLTLKKPWIKNIDLPLNFSPWPWNYCLYSCLEFQGFSRLNLEKPWPWNFNFSLPWPWIENSKIELRTLKILEFLTPGLSFSIFYSFTHSWAPETNWQGYAFVHLLFRALEKKIQILCTNFFGWILYIPHLFHSG